MALYACYLIWTSVILKKKQMYSVLLLLQRTNSKNETNNVLDQKFWPIVFGQSKTFSGIPIILHFESR